MNHLVADRKSRQTTSQKFTAPSEKEAGMPNPIANHKYTQRNYIVNHHTIIINYNSLEDVGQPRSSRLQIYMKIYLYNNCNLNATHKQNKTKSIVANNNDYLFIKDSELWRTMQTKRQTLYLKKNINKTRKPKKNLIKLLNQTSCNGYFQEILTILIHKHISSFWSVIFVSASKRWKRSEK